MTRRHLTALAGMILSLVALSACSQSPPATEPAASATPEAEAQQPAATSPAPAVPPPARDAGATATAAPRAAAPGTAPSSPPEATQAPPATPAAPPAAPDRTAAEPSRPVDEFREVTVPAGTRLTVILETPVSSDGSKVEDVVRGRLASAVTVDGVEALPAGAAISGTVAEATPAGRVKGVGRVAVRFDRVTPYDEDLPLRTSRYAVEARSTKGEDAKKVGIGAGAGAIVGAIAGGGKGAAVGAGVGGAAGTGVVLATRGEEARIEAGTRFDVTLQQPLTVRVPVARGR